MRAFFSVSPDCYFYGKFDAPVNLIPFAIEVVIKLVPRGGLSIAEGRS
jgi:hypothetical protein